MNDDLHARATVAELVHAFCAAAALDSVSCDPLRSVVMAYARPNSRATLHVRPAGAAAWLLLGAPGSVTTRDLVDLADLFDGPGEVIEIKVVEMTAQQWAAAERRDFAGW